MDYFDKKHHKSEGKSSSKSESRLQVPNGNFANRLGKNGTEMNDII